jgi:cytidine deaminase
MAKKETNAMHGALMAHAKKASELAYCAYSHYCVGAAVLTFDDQIYSGCNIENFGFTQTIHAEQTAMSNAISSGALQRALAKGLTQLDFIKAIAVYAPKGTDPWPCCNCRQSLNEFGLTMDVIGEGAQGMGVSETLEKLIPHAFKMETVLASVHGPDWKKHSQADAKEIGSLSRPIYTEVGDTRQLQRQEALMQAAKEASQLAYCPYSNYSVGAAILTFDGRIYTGCNIENCSYTQTIHAEQAALSKAISDGALRRALDAGLTQFNFVEALAFFSPKSADSWPSCNGRQFLSEFGLRMEVIGESKKGALIRKSLGELVPFSFPMEHVFASVHGESPEG